MRRALTTLLAIGTLGLAACAQPDYFLTPPAAPAPASAGGVASVAVADMNLPTYADAVEIAVLGPGGAVTLEKDALWADTPRRALTRHLVAALQDRLPRAQVSTEPWPAFDPPQLRVEVFVDRMIGAPEGPFEFSGQFVVVAQDSGRIVASDRFAIGLQAGASYQGLVDAHARAVEALADRIVARVARIG